MRHNIIAVGEVESFIIHQKTCSLPRTQIWGSLFPPWSVIFYEDFNVTIDKIEWVGHVGMISPEMFRNGFFGQNFIAVAEKIHEQFMFFWSDWSFYRSHTWPFHPEAHEFVVGNLPFAFKCPSANHWFDTCSKFRHIERFSDVVVRSDIEPGQAIVREFRAEQHYSCFVLPFLHFLDQFQTISIRRINPAQYSRHMKSISPCRRQIRSLFTYHPGFFQKRLPWIAIILFIFN